MARILAKKNSSDQKKLIQVRHALDFYREELDGLDEKYQDIMKKAVDDKDSAFYGKHSIFIFLTKYY